MMFVPYIIFACIILFLRLLAPYRLRGSRNGALSILCSLVVKGIPKQGLVCFLSYGRFFCVLCAYAALFPCFWLSVPVQSIAWKDSSLNDLPVLCVEWV